MLFSLSSIHTKHAYKAVYLHSDQLLSIFSALTRTLYRAMSTVRGEAFCSSLRSVRMFLHVSIALEFVFVYCFLLSLVPKLSLNLRRRPIKLLIRRQSPVVSSLIDRTRLARSTTGPASSDKFRPLFPSRRRPLAGTDRSVGGGLVLSWVRRRHDARVSHSTTG